MNLNVIAACRINRMETGVIGNGIELRIERNPGFFYCCPGLYCDVAWDEIYCWQPTRAGENVSRPCSEVMKDDPEIPHPEDILGIAFLYYFGAWTPS